MKTKSKLFVTILLPFLVASISGCGTIQDADSKTITIFDLDATKSEDINSGKAGSLKAFFHKDEEHVPYISLKQYASLYDSHFADSTESKVIKQGNLITWTIYLDSQLCFISQIDIKNQTVIGGGSISTALKGDDSPVDTAALIYGVQTDYDGDYLGSSPYARYSYADIDLKTINYSGDVYFPLGFFDITYSFDSGIYFYYNYVGIYSTHNVDDYYLRTYKNAEGTWTVNKEMLRHKNCVEMPDYLKKYNLDLFMYLLDNFYGLKEYKGINKAIDYCKEIGTYDKMLSNKDSERAQAYADTLSKLDDNHTALVAGNETWGEQSFITRQYGDGCKNRSALRNQLVDLRTSSTHISYFSGEEPIVSSDGKTAMYLFDSFVYGTSEQVFNNDRTIKEDAWKYDSFFALIRLFNRLKEVGNVKNVVLDMSTNGGGVLGVLMKLSALISKTNLGALYYYEAGSKQVGIAHSKIDIDADGFYDRNDCFGDDFNIYLLTSDCSFSCGNAFPCQAKIDGSAKIIGQKSGGGECAVGIHNLPNGQYVYHSSNLHIGYYNDENRTFTGFEDGATPDIEINNYNDFYNIDRLASYLS